MQSRYEIAVVGYALANCPSCFGTGRLGYLGGFERGVVQPCGCCVFFESKRLKEEAEKYAQQEQQRIGNPPVEKK